MASQVTLKNNIPILNKSLLAAFSEGLVKAGHVGEIKITEKILSNIPPPLKESTIRAKGSSTALIDTGEMLGAVSSELRDGGKSVAMGIIGNSPAATRGIMNEYGTKNIPERSWLRSTFNDTDNITELNDAVTKTIKQAVIDSAIK